MDNNLNNNINNEVNNINNFEETNTISNLNILNSNPNLKQNSQINNIEDINPTKIENKSNNISFGSILGIMLAIILSLGITFFKTNDVFSKNKTPIEAYKVYLKGESIGLIKSDKELYDYINKMQKELMDKYKVDNVYIPNDIDVEKDITYQENITSVSNIYNIINDKEPFTIKGYRVLIDKTNATEYLDDTETHEDRENVEKKVFINILDKDVFNASAKKVVLSFVSEQDFNDYENEIEKTIMETGEKLENLYIDAKITFTDAYLPVNEKIYTSEDELTEYLLFGKNQNMSTYTVQDGDTLATVAEANKMNVNEVLIANSNLGSSNALLYTGQQLTVGVLDPIFQTVKEIHKVEDQTIAYKTEVVYDNSQLVGYQATRTQGSNGINRVTQKIKEVNGEIVNALISNTEEIKPVVDEVIVKGGKQPVIVSAGNWGWPTNIPYIISSHFGWRWGRLHAGVDISGTGYGSPIYAAQAGVVVDVGYNGLSGNFVQIDHRNGYYSRYAHMVTISPYVKKGDYVTMGQTIGDMGCSGNCYGTHLHFEIWRGAPYNGGEVLNPLLFY